MDLLNTLKDFPYRNQRDLSKRTGYSLGKVNSSIKILLEEKYLNETLHLTTKSKKVFEMNKPKQAVILAAGLGMRMIPINVEVSKGMLEIKDEPLIERIIKQLHEVQIKKIKIVVGFMKEQYEYLIDKYNIELVFNENYLTRNNLYSLAKVSNDLENTYIIPCDIWCKKNPFSQNELYSWYMVSREEDEKSKIKINRKRELKVVSDKENGDRMIGISYVCGSESLYLKRHLTEMIGQKKYYHSFWEEAAIQNGRMIFHPKEVPSAEVFEINTLEELRDLDKNSNQLNSDLFDIIINVLNCKAGEIVEIEALKKGMTNRSFLFRCRNKRYIMRVPGEGTEMMINRQQEYNVYETIKEEKICDPICYISPEKGYKITEFLEGAKVCNPYDMTAVKSCMKYLRKIHAKKYQVEHTFDLFEQIEQYESYWQGAKSIYKDYIETKAKIYELKKYVDIQEKSWTLTHIDAVPDNFLFVNDRIYLIDWEYAGMQDPHIDIAMFSIYSMYGKTEIDELIDFYFENNCSEHVRTKIYCYIAICGFLWSNWCEYKRMCGVEFGEYSLKQYRYAKEYYKIAKERIANE